MTSAADVIEAFGGQTEVAGILGVSVQAVWNMKDRNAIPPRHWTTLVSEANGRGLKLISFEALAQIGAPSNAVKRSAKA